MSSKLEELRRRFQGLPTKADEARAGAAPSEVATSAEAMPEATRPKLAGLGGPPARASAMAEAVARIFDQTRGFKPAFEELVGTIDVLDHLGETTARAFGPLQAFQSHLVYLVACFEPVQTFQESLRQLAQKFAPARPLHDEMARLTESLQAEIATLIKMLEPAKYGPRRPHQGRRAGRRPQRFRRRSLSLEAHPTPREFGLAKTTAG